MAGHIIRVSCKKSPRKPDVGRRVIVLVFYGGGGGGGDDGHVLRSPQRPFRSDGLGSFSETSPTNPAVPENVTTAAAATIRIVIVIMIFIVAIIRGEMIRHRVASYAYANASARPVISRG